MPQANDRRVPHEFSKVGIGTPEEAADYVAGIIGFMSIERMKDSADRAGREGRVADQEFYQEVFG